MQIVTVNVLAAFVATIANFLVSGLLHGIVFKKIPVGSAKNVKMSPITFLVAFGATFLMMYVLAHVLAFAETANYLEGIQGAAWMWLGFVMPLQIAVKYTNNQAWKTFAVNTVCALAGLAAAGAIIGAW